VRIVRQFEGLPADVQGASLAIGNFDGVHRGHQAVILEAAKAAKRHGGPFGVLTFEPHPRRFFQPNAPADRLTPFRPKSHALEALGVEVMAALHFDAALAALSPEAFVDKVLVGGFAVRHVVVGFDFAFGKGRAGNPALLKSLGEAKGFGVGIVEPVGESNSVFSSTLIRKLLTAGRPDEAAKLLGRAFEVDGHVQHGDARGRQIGFPTANLTLGDYLQPALGVYAVEFGIERPGGIEWRKGVANLGRRPTFGKEQVLLEVHVFDFAGDLYGANARVRLIAYLRPERKFPSLDALKAQIAEDAAAARRVLAGGT
jgi:riboflavin kinase/FMN adenylyltransferase